ncbi:MAG: DUF6194 family protein [Oceanicaulis sp.]
MDMGRLRALIETRFDGLAAKQSWGETSFFYNPGARFANGSYFATLKDRDGPNDTASGLDRPGAYRLNFGMSPKTFKARFGEKPARPPKGEAITGAWDFTAQGVLTPHPIYGWMGWAAIVTPREDQLDEVLELLGEAHERARKGFEKRARAT